MHAVFYACAAVAAGFDAPQVGSVDSGPVTSDAAATFFNPALLATLEAPSVMVGAGVVAGRISVQRDRLGDYVAGDGLWLQAPDDPAALDPSLSGPADAVGTTPVSALGDLFVAVPAGPVGLGFGAYVPYAAVLDFPVDGPQRYAVQDTTVLISHLAAGAGVQLGKVSVGARGAFVLGFAELDKVQDLAGLNYFRDVFGDPPIQQPNDFGRSAPSTVREQELLSRQLIVRRAVARTFTFAVGTAADLGAWRLSASYDHGSKPVFVGQFTLDTDEPFYTDDLEAFGFDYPRVPRGDASLSVGTPRRIRLGLSRDLSSALEGRLAVTWSDWTRYEGTEFRIRSDAFANAELGLTNLVETFIVRDWQPSLGIEAGVSHTGFTAAVGYESPASPDATVDAVSPDGHRLIARGGAKVGLSEPLALWVGGKLQGIVPRTVTTSDFDLGNGTYNLFLGSLSLNLIYTAR
ncbi:MAG: outer membrane protein transport protein [Myxococcales bacterium]|nr:outer membrane protein transport protein [Myxococcales bacterium]